MNVAYVEDDEMLREVFSRQFRKLFSTITVYHEPEEALMGLRQNPKDIVFCDLWMPKMDGKIFYKEFRTFSPETPFVFISGELDLTPHLANLNPHRLYALHKPCRQSDMLNLLSALNPDQNR